MTPAEIRARIAISDGSDQGEILEAAFDSFAPQPPNGREHLEDAMRWIALREKMQTFLRAQAHTDAALLIAEAALPGWKLAQLGEAEISMTGWKARFSQQLDELQVEAFAAGRQIVITAFEVNSPTRALAILDAVCAAKGG